MNTLVNTLAPLPDATLNDRLYAKARYVVQLVQGSQILEAAAVDAAGYARLVEAAAQMLRKGDPRKLGEAA